MKTMAWNHRLGYFFALPMLAMLHACVSSTLDPEPLRPVGTGSAGLAYGVPPADNDLESRQQTALPGAPEPLPSVTGTSTPPAQADNGSVTDPVRRQQAVDEIRQKAQSQSGNKTMIGPVPESAAPAMSDAQKAQMQRELSRTLEAQENYLSDAEIRARQQKMRLLQSKGLKHYKDAVDQIEN